MSYRNNVVAALKALARTKEERVKELIEKLNEIIARDPDSPEGKNAAKRLEELTKKYPPDDESSTSDGEIIKETAASIEKALEVIEHKFGDGNPDVTVFAEAVAEVLKNTYGTHNFEAFKTVFRKL